MKVLDEKGKLFGKINIIDLAVLLAVVLVAVFLGMKLLGGGGGLGGNTKLTYTVRVENVTEEVYLAIEKQLLPDQLMAAGNLLNGHVVSMSAQPSQRQQLLVKPNDAGLPAGIEYNATNRYDLIFTVEAFVANAVKNEVGTQEVRVGKSHIVKTQNFELTEGTITSCTKEEVAS